MTTTMRPQARGRKLLRRQTQMAQAEIKSAASRSRRSRPAPDDRAKPQPLELILARNLASSVALAAILVDVDGKLVYFNDAAAKIIGGPFAEIGTMTREQWNARHGPVDEHGVLIAADRLPLAVAVREGRPAFDRFRIRGDSGLLEVEAAALPLVGAGGYHGAMVTFWVADDAAAVQSQPARPSSPCPTHRRPAPSRAVAPAGRGSRARQGTSQRQTPTDEPASEPNAVSRASRMRRASTLGGGDRLFLVFFVATLIMVATVVVLGIVARWWVLVPAMLVFFAATFGVIGAITRLLGENGDR